MTRLSVIRPVGLALLVVLNSLVMASEGAAAITADSIALSGETFFAGFASPDELHRNAARLYFLGVMDATEGRVWCSYRTMKTLTVREYVFEYFKKLPRHRLSERAAVLIEEALAHSFPCTGANK